MHAGGPLLRAKYSYGVWESFLHQANPIPKTSVCLTCLPSPSPIFKNELSTTGAKYWERNVFLHGSCRSPCKTFSFQTYARGMKYNYTIQVVTFFVMSIRPQNKFWNGVNMSITA